jgi:hypothetical protein
MMSAISTISVMIEMSLISVMIMMPAPFRDDEDVRDICDDNDVRDIRDDNDVRDIRDVYEYVYGYICVYVYTVCMRGLLHSCYIYIYTERDRYIYIYTHTHMCMHTCVHAYMHTYMRASIHECNPSRTSNQRQTRFSHLLSDLSPASL